MSEKRASGEFQLIDSFLQPFGLARDGRARAGNPVRATRRDAGEAGVLIGPGDDCAQLVPARGMTLVITTDAALDGVHFQLGRSPPRSSAEDAGWKALAMNLSDLAAAGARPRWFVCALGVPAKMRAGKTNNEKQSAERQAIVRGLGAGMAELAKENAIALVGGNITKASQWSITITALGEAKKPLSRAGARPGDRLVLIGALGEAALGLTLLQRKRRATALGAGESASVQAQIRPVPLVRAGLVAARYATAAIDISDGLLQDLRHLCERSGCDAAIDLENLPRSTAVRAAEATGAKRGCHPYALSLTGGEDYALLCAVPAERMDSFCWRLLKEGILSEPVGTLLRRSQAAAEPVISLWENGREVPAPEQAGFDHFR